MLDMARLHCLCVTLCFAALIASSQAVTTGTACGPSFNFFPPGAVDSNLPSAWGKTAQTAAGNLRNDQLYNVALTSTRNVPGINANDTAPLLHVVPVHDLLTVGSSPSRACQGYGATASATKSVETAMPTAAAASTVLAAATRHLMQADSSNGDESAGAPGRRLTQSSVTAPAKFKIQYWVNKTAVVDLRQFKSVTPAPKINLTQLAGYADGYYCLNIKVTIIAYSGLMGSTAVPVEDLHTTTQVCFYKLDGMPNATVEFKSCGESFSVNITNMQPKSIPLYPGSSDLLFRPVFHFVSDLNVSKTGKWPEGEPPKLDQWIVLEPVNNSAPFIYTPDDQLPEGYYNIKLDSGLATTFPSLMSLGVAGVDKYTDETSPEEIRDQLKFLQYKHFPSGKLLGIQNSVTQFVSMNGPELDSSIPVNSDISFNWEWEGFGKQYCWMDGLKYYNDADFTCKPPLNFVLPNTKNHTLTVILQDVCSKNYTVEVTYGTWGYALTKVPNKTTASIDLDLANGGGVYDMVSTGTTTVRRASVSAAGSVSSKALMLLPLLLALMYGSRQLLAQTQ